jgi:hypothetical protein
VDNRLRAAVPVGIVAVKLDSAGTSVTTASEELS